MLFSFAVLASSVALAGCDGGTPKPEPTPTSAAPGAAISTSAPDALTLASYLILTLRIDADMNRGTAELSEALSSLQADPRAVLLAVIELEQGISVLAREGADELFGLTPPPEAKAYHTALLAMLRDLEAVAGEAAAAFEANDPSRVSAAQIEFTVLTTELGGLAEQAQRLAITALAAKSDAPLNTYLIAAAEARLGVAAALSDYGARLLDLQSSVETAEDLPALLRLIEELIERLVLFQSEWEELSPPPQASELHQRQAELNADTIAAERLLLAAMRDPSEADPFAATQSLVALSPQGASLAADWTELLIEALSR